MAERRPVGALEQAVLACLWSADGPLAPRDVLDRLDADLAYTTVMTILTRLAAKGLVDRQRQGRGFVYRVTLSEADLVAARMQAALAAAGDRRATLSRFAEGLSKSEAEVLRGLLGELDGPPEAHDQRRTGRRGGRR